MKLKGEQIKEYLAQFGIILQDRISPLSNSLLTLRIFTDFASAAPMIHVSSPDEQAQEQINIFLGLRAHQAHNLAAAINLPREYWQSFAQTADSLYRCYVKSDALFAELAPLMIGTERTFYALNAALEIDEDALFRQPQFSLVPEYPDLDQQAANEAGIDYVRLEGQIGCIANGAGLALATMDAIARCDGGRCKPANFLDIGDNFCAETLITALRLILKLPKVASVLINLFDTSQHSETTAQAILQAYYTLQPHVPIIVRLSGLHAEAGLQRLADAALPTLIVVSNFEQAAQKAVEYAKWQS